MSPPARLPLVNRALVGILGIACLVGGVSAVLFDSYENPWGGALIRVGTVLAVLWFALPTPTRPAAWTGISPWVTVSIVAIGIFAARRPLLFFPLAGIVMLIVLIARPRPRRHSASDSSSGKSESGSNRS
jgi:hypothetical protein